MTKVLVVETNVMQYGDRAEPTGLWLGEAAEFVSAMAAHHVAVDYVSPKGGFVPLDPRSMRYVDADIMRVYEQPDFIDRALTHTLAPAAVNPADYAAIYYTGGHGVMWDFPDEAGLAQLAAAIHAQGGIVASVCHGIAGLLNVTAASGQRLIAGRTITGFTASEELLAGKRRIVPFLNRQAATARGAHFVQKRAYREFAVQDGQLITGQNPFSVKAVARLVLAAIG
ncbi:type 1 glutamine amidotransferase domain-containing protein [Lacticaseibacillus suihuaensis]